MLNHAEWHDVLKENVAKVTFLKADGTLREMRCTLKSEYLPQMITEEGSEVQRKRMQNESVVSVWDLDNNGWRSFRVDSVQDVQLLGS